MDYGNNGIKSGDLSSNTFYLREGVEHNVGDIGNYLFGRGMAELQISLWAAQTGAHVNNMLSGRRQNTGIYDFGPGTNNGPGLFDSKGDQAAMSRGYKSHQNYPSLLRRDMEWPKFYGK